MRQQVVLERGCIESRSITVDNFVIDKLDESVNFGLWQVKMRTLLVHIGLEKLLRITRRTLLEVNIDQWEKIDMKALTAIQLCLCDEVLTNVLKEITAVGVN